MTWSSGEEPAATGLRERLRSRRFWAVQALVVLVTATHAMVEWLELLTGYSLDAAYFVPASLYFIPVLYASLRFGREGAVPTALWAGLLAIPNMLIWHSGLERVGEATQLLVVVIIALIVSGRVDRETTARHRAETEESSRRASEARYRSLFESAAEPILILDADGTIEEGNAAASALFGRPAAQLRGLDLTRFVDPAAAAVLLRLVRSERSSHKEILIRTADDRRTWVEPVCSAFKDSSGKVMVQAVLRDVTERRERQQGLESYAQQMQQVQEEERLRIARELHDGSVQSLVALCRKLDSVEEATEIAALGDVNRTIRDAREAAEAVADELRRFSRDLRPSVLDNLGLVPAVRWVVNDLERRTGMRGTFTVEGPEQRVHSDVELCLFRIAQEALRNVEHHARASRARVRISFAGTLRLIVADDGRGFDAARNPDGRAPDHLGLLGMKERVRLLGGELRVASSPGAGTSVEASIPMTARPGDGRVRPGTPGHWSREQRIEQ
ncbi:MAG: PAS domain-containing sensor histidine kinase [Actinomycetota bacterium]